MPTLESSLEENAVSASMLKSWHGRLIVSVGVDCDNDIHNSGVLTKLSDCNMRCTGNSQEFCGGSDRLNLFYTLPL